MISINIFLLVLHIAALTFCDSKPYTEVIIKALEHRDVRVAGFVVAAASQYDKQQVLDSVDIVKTDCTTRQLFVKALKYVTYQGLQWSYMSDVFDEAIMKATQGSCSGQDDFRKQTYPSKYKLEHLAAKEDPYDQEYLYIALRTAIQNAFSQAIYRVVNGEDAYTSAAISATIIFEEISATVGLFETPYLNVSSLPDEELVRRFHEQIKRGFQDYAGKIFGQCSYQVVADVLFIINPPSFNKKIKKEIEEAISDPQNIFIMPLISEITVYLKIDNVASKVFAAVAPQLLNVVDSTCFQWATTLNVNSTWDQHIRTLYERTRNFSSRIP